MTWQAIPSRPYTAVQSFDFENLRIRNGIYLGPIKFFFDGPFIWRENVAGGRFENRHSTDVHLLFLLLRTFRAFL